jgi:hypothetical protein
VSFRPSSSRFLGTHSYSKQMEAGPHFRNSSLPYTRFVSIVIHPHRLCLNPPLTDRDHR